MMNRRNIQLSTFNRQRPRAACRRVLGCSILKVECWMFPLVLFLCTSSLLLGQTNSETTNALPKLLPPYAELPPTFWEQHGTSVLLIGLGVILLAGWVVWLWLRPKPKVILPPDVQARNGLEAIRQRPEDGALLSGVSQILRRYFIAAFQLPPGEPTTAEFCRTLSSREQIGGELATTVSDFLHRCDEQKFSPTKSAASLGAVNQALALIEKAEARRAQTQAPSRT